jgi:hypothetical protein
MKTISDIVHNCDLTAENFAEKLDYYSKHLDSNSIITALAGSLLASFKMNDNAIVKGIILTGLDELLSSKINTEKKVKKQSDSIAIKSENDFNCTGYTLERLPIKKFKLSVKRGG